MGAICVSLETVLWARDVELILTASSSGENLTTSGSSWGASSSWADALGFKF